MNPALLATLGTLAETASLKADILPPVSGENAPAFTLPKMAVAAAFAGTLPWIATMVTAAWGAYGTSAACYYAKAKAENTAGGVTYETVCRGQDCEG